ncbi:hypothetical protein [Streptomyces sp. NPDC002932]|uniref:hypothetical protein n=1 Tax=Streptomyces sp. NPDC002932 TaxID=3364672 RepID=UPI0036AF42C3
MLICVRSAVSGHGSMPHASETERRAATDQQLRASCPGDALTEALDAADNIYSPRGRAY